ncbi:MAG TPA: UDP-N-acetylglucosamine 1-carboxyvinyltransferase [Terriglobales bacterium]|nr:UDP-N-acetylglucosamine 1-carboxyvinyltransferase [Terriglobales bacterium]
MDKFVIRGGNPLLGTIRISGAKNAALPAMAAALLTDETVVLENIPQVRDIVTERNLLAAMGAQVELGYGRAQHRTTINCGTVKSPEASYELVKTMRASTLVLGPLVAKFGKARVSMPGGCAIGARPIDLHIKGLERLGANITQDHGYVEASGKLTGGHILFDKITVTGTEDLLMAATLADGETVMENCAREPEVVDLAELLIKMGARIEGHGTSTIKIRGVSRLGGARHRIIPDRIEAGTFIIAGAITGGDLNVAGCDPNHISALLNKLEEAGVKLQRTHDSVRVIGTGASFQSADVTTEEHPGFATDMQAQYMALMTQSEGTSIITENIFENRFMHAQELVRMGANIKIEGRRAIVRGKSPLSGSAVLASDLRASASLVLAALVAEGETIIDRVYHIDRGYERIEEKLRGVGAEIKRMGEMFPKRAAVPVAHS